MKRTGMLVVASALVVSAAVPCLGDTTPVKPRPVIPLTAQQKTAAAQATRKTLDTLQSEVAKRVAQLAADRKKSHDEAVVRGQTELASKLKAGRIKPVKIVPGPTVTEVYAPGGATPLASITILGSNFSINSPLEVHVRFAQQDLLANPLPGSTADRIDATMPDFAGIAGPTPATLVVKAANVVSDPATMTVLPAIVTDQIDLTAMKTPLTTDFRGTPLVYDPTKAKEYGVADSFALQDNQTIAGMHTRQYQSADAKGTDEYFLTTQLKNNWVVKDIVFMPACSIGQGADPNQTCAALWKWNRNTSSLYTQVGWFNFTMNLNMSYYYVRYIVEGPKGMPYW